MRSWLGDLIHPEEGYWLARRDQVGMEKGERGIAVRRKTWHSQWGAGAALPALTIPCIFQPKGHLSSLVICRFAADVLQSHTPGAVTKGKREGATWDWASVHYKNTHHNCWEKTGPAWISFHCQLQQVF